MTIYSTEQTRHEIILGITAAILGNGACREATEQEARELKEARTVFHYISSDANAKMRELISKEVLDQLRNSHTVEGKIRSIEGNLFPTTINHITELLGTEMKINPDMKKFNEEVDQLVKANTVLDGRSFLNLVAGFMLGFNFNVYQQDPAPFRAKNRDPDKN